MLPIHFARYIVRPALAHVGNGVRGFETEVAVWLVTATAAAESEFRALDQVTGPNDRTFGPGLGLCQMEHGTAEDIWDNWLKFRPDWRMRVQSLLAPVPDRTTQLASNLSYGAVMCRLRYWREPDCVLPAKVDRDAFARIWKRFYNTRAGAGTEAAFAARFDRYIAPYITEPL